MLGTVQCVVGTMNSWSNGDMRERLYQREHQGLGAGGGVLLPGKVASAESQVEAL